jgi:ATP-dependent protease ClpP protease subunit
MVEEEKKKKETELEMENIEKRLNELEAKIDSLKLGISMAMILADLKHIRNRLLMCAFNNIPIHKPLVKAIGELAELHDAKADIYTMSEKYLEVLEKYDAQERKILDTLELRAHEYVEELKRQAEHAAKQKAKFEEFMKAYG